MSRQSIYVSITFFTYTYLQHLGLATPIIEWPSQGEMHVWEIWLRLSSSGLREVKSTFERSFTHGVVSHSQRPPRATQVDANCRSRDIDCLSMLSPTPENFAKKYLFSSTSVNSWGTGQLYRSSFLSQSETAVDRSRDTIPAVFVCLRYPSSNSSNSSSAHRLAPLPLPTIPHIDKLTPGILRYSLRGKGRGAAAAASSHHQLPLSLGAGMCFPFVANQSMW